MVSWKDWPIKMASSKEISKLFGKSIRLPKNIYYRGCWTEEIFSSNITIVGSRKMTRYGEEAIKRLVPEIVKRGVAVVSGMMYGVDTCAHQMTLDNGGKTIAVVGGGLDRVANSYNQKLYTNILENGGMVMSEYPQDFEPTKWSFPQRDRLMAAMATIGVLVVEGGMNSGSLITANYAHKFNKNLFAIPGPINSKVSQGTNWLISTGKAKMVTTAEELLGDKNASNQETLFKDYSGLDTNEKNIISLLETEPLSLDEISRKLKLPVIETASAISMLSLRDLVEEKDGNIYLN